MPTVHYTTNAFAISQGLVPRTASWYRSRQRKATEAPPKDKKNPNTIRIKAGRLAALKDMPLEIFYAIMGWLHPVDLIHLSRASKLFRSLLMSKKNACLWAAARTNVPALPDCPQVLSEPRYAAFLFDQYCFACGIERSTNLDFTLALRFCAPCYKANILKSAELVFPELSNMENQKLYWSALVAACSESTHYKHTFGGSIAEYSHHNEYYVVEAHAVRDELRKLRLSDDTVTMRAFLKERSEYVQQMQTHGLAVYAWWYKTLRHKDEAREDRSRAMQEKLFELGYQERDFPVDNPAWERILKQPTRLNDRIWKTARPKLLALIEQEQQSRLQAALQKRLVVRMEEFAPYYDEFVKTVPEDDRPFMPNLHDASLLPCVNELLSEDDGETPVTLVRFTAISDKILEDAQKYIGQARRDLLQMQHDECHGNRYRLNKMPMPAYDATQIDAELAKASSLFICHHCPLKTSMSARDICTHWREHLLLKWNDNWPPNEHSDRRRRFSDWPKNLPWVSAMGRGESSTKAALSALGLAEGTSHAELDQLVRDGRLICACGDPMQRPAQESSWAVLISHVVTQQDWYTQRQYRLPTYYRGNPGKELIDNHSLKSCLKLLDLGEEPKYPDYKVEQAVADEIAAVIVRSASRPICKICYNMTKENSRCKLLWMPKDVNILAHHMKTRHGVRLRKDLIIFECFRC